MQAVASEWLTRLAVPKPVLDLLRDERVAVAAMSGWLVFVMAVFFSLGGYKVNRLIRFDFGPSDSLYFVGVHINTWPRWMLLLAFVAIDALIECWPDNVVQPWVLTTVYAADPRPLCHSRATTMSVTNLYAICGYVRRIIELYIAFTQIDVLMVRLLSMSLASLITSWATIRLREQPRSSAYAYVRHDGLLPT